MNRPNRTWRTAQTNTPINARSLS